MPKTPYQEESTNYPAQHQGIAGYEPVTYGTASAPPPPGFVDTRSSSPGGFINPHAPPPSGFVNPYAPPPAGFVNPHVSPPPGTVNSQAPPSQPAMYGTSSAYDASSYDEPFKNDQGFEFSDQTIRKAFIRKVYSILMCQLLVTSCVVALFTYHQPTKQFVSDNSWIFWVAFAATFITLIAMACCGEVRRHFPMNFILLGIFTLAESVLLGTAASSYDSEAVLMAAGLTCAVCLGLTLFAFQTKWDFTVLGAGLFIALFILIIFGIVAIIFPGKVILMIYASCGVLLFSLYLIYDTQMMMGGKHKYAISPEEYIFAALNLYLDIVNIFLYLLTIIGLAKN